MITDKLRSLLAAQIETLVDAGNGKVGAGGNSTSPAATDIDVLIVAADSVSAIKSTENIVELKLSISGSSLVGETVREIGFFDSSGNLLFRTNFDGIGSLTSSDTLEVFVSIEVE